MGKPTTSSGGTGSQRVKQKARTRAKDSTGASAVSKKVVPEMGGMGKLCLPVQLRDSVGKLRLSTAPKKLNDLTGDGTSWP